MKTAKLIGSLVLILFCLLSLDGIFFYLVQSQMSKMINNIQQMPMKINWLYFILCYLVLTFAIYYFIIRLNRPLVDAFLLGMTIYAVFETTNAAIFTKWQKIIVLIDILWGGILFLLVKWLYDFFFQKL